MLFVQAGAREGRASDPVRSAPRWPDGPARRPPRGPREYASRFRDVHPATRDASSIAAWIRAGVAVSKEPPACGQAAPGSRSAVTDTHRVAVGTAALAGEGTKPTATADHRLTAEQRFEIFVREFLGEGDRCRAWILDEIVLLQHGEVLSFDHEPMRCVGRCPPDFRRCTCYHDAVRRSEAVVKDRFAMSL